MKIVKKLSMRTDLAVEMQEVRKVSEQDGVFQEEISQNGIAVTRVKITDQKGADALGKPVGEYITVDFKDSFSDEQTHQNAVETTAGEISRLLFGEKDPEKKINPDGPGVLVIGLGNRRMMSDAVGPATIDRILVTRHIQNNMPELYQKLALHPVSAAAPGVLGQTGIEASEVVQSLCREIRPEAVILIDALASRRMERLCRTVQISNTGICPGSGVGNKRAEISSRTLGVPVISIGVPMVVDAVTLTADTVELALRKIRESLDGENSAVLNAFSAFEEYDGEEIIRGTLSPFDMNLVVTPKDIDRLTEKCAGLLALALNKTLQGGLSEEEISALLGL